MPLLFAAMFVAAFIYTAPAVIADAVATWRASKAGDFGFVDKGRDRRAARNERWAAAWAARRRSRSRDAGGDGTYRPGAREYFGDLYHGFWERSLERSKAKQAARPPYEYDPDRPTWRQRLTDAIGDKVERLRERRNSGERAATSDPAMPWDDPQWDPSPPTDPDRNDHAGPPATPTLYAVSQEYQREREAEDWAASRERFDAGRTDPSKGSAIPPRLHVVKPQPIKGEHMTTDVITNEAARQAFAAMATAAAKLQEAAAQAEAARAEISAAATAVSDAMSGTRFDADATAAAAEINSEVNSAALSTWCEIADNVTALAAAGHAALDKYRDAEDLVAQTGVDTDTLASTSS